MLVSPERGIYKQPENNKYQENGMEEMLAPMEEMDEEDEKQEIEMGRRSQQQGTPIPVFLLVMAKRGTKLDGREVSADVINVKCAREDEAWVMHLMVQAFNTD